MPNEVEDSGNTPRDLMPNEVEDPGNTPRDLMPNEVEDPGNILRDLMPIEVEDQSNILRNFMQIEMEDPGKDCLFITTVFSFTVDLSFIHYMYIIKFESVYSIMCSHHVTTLNPINNLIFF